MKAADPGQGASTNRLQRTITRYIATQSDHRRHRGRPPRNYDGRRSTVGRESEEIAEDSAHGRAAAVYKAHLFHVSYFSTGSPTFYTPYLDSGGARPKLSIVSYARATPVPPLHLYYYPVLIPFRQSPRTPRELALTLSPCLAPRAWTYYTNRANSFRHRNREFMS
jgi:hypothetical protein